MRLACAKWGEKNDFKRSVSHNPVRFNIRGILFPAKNRRTHSELYLNLILFTSAPPPHLNTAITLVLARPSLPSVAMWTTGMDVQKSHLGDCTGFYYTIILGISFIRNAGCTSQSVVQNADQFFLVIYCFSHYLSKNIPLWFKFSPMH